MSTDLKACSMPGPVLVGMRGVGKSTVGRKLAKQLNLPMVDADRVLESELGQPIADIFRDKGEAWFRTQEEALLLRLLADDHSVLATGGGAVLHESVRTAMTRRPTIWLTSPIPALVERLEHSNRPRLITDAPDLRSEIETIFAQRKPLYESVAQLKIDTTVQSVDGVVLAIVQYWHSLTNKTA